MSKATFVTLASFVVAGGGFVLGVTAATLSVTPEVDVVKSPTTVVVTKEVPVATTKTVTNHDVPQSCLNLIAESEQAVRSAQSLGESGDAQILILEEVRVAIGSGKINSVEFNTELQDKQNALNNKTLHSVQNLSEFQASFDELKALCEQDLD